MATCQVVAMYLVGGCEQSSGWLRAILWLFFFGSREENVLDLGRQLESHVCIDDINDEL